MIEHLSGTLASKQNDHVVISVGGVGYGVTVPLSTVRDLPRINEPVFLHTRMIVREDDMRLFGFAREQERELFDLLLGISGVGARVAVDIISHVALPQLIDAVKNANPAILTAVPGIGKKRAEKLIFDLNRSKSTLLAATPGVESSSGQQPAAPVSGSNDAFDALVALGMKPPDAQRALSRAMETLGEDADTSLLIKEAIRHR